MYVCLCKGITDSQIRDAVNAGAESMRQVRDTLGVATQCGKCACDTRDIVKSVLESGSNNNPIFFEVA